MPPIIHIKKTKSTNSYLKERLLVQDMEEGSVIYADYQTEGRGQVGNKWESEAGRNLLFSMVIYPNMVKATDQFIISQLVSLAIKDYLSKRIDDVSIKWPNDIYWKDKKIGGMLIENVLLGDTIKQSIIGVGLNINQIKFKSDAPNPVSLRQINDGRECDRTAILQLITYYIQAYYSDVKKGETDEIIKRYKESLFRRQGYHLYFDGNNYFPARIKDVETNGAIILETQEGEMRRFLFKEVAYM